VSQDRRTAGGHRPARGRPAPTLAQQPDPTARSVALEVLRRVHADQAYANLALPPLLADRGLDARDAGLATELAYGTLRAQGSYDAILSACVDRPIERLDPAVLDVLRLGAHQLLSMRIDSYAAVNESVNLARHRIGHGPAGLVNAVLRKVAARDFDSWVDALSSDADPIARMTLGYAHPRWIVEAFAAALHGDLEETAAALAADNVRPEVALAARPGHSTVEELIALGARPGRWAATAVILSGGAPSDLAPIQERRAGVQDEGSQLVALAVAAAPIAGTDLRWLDMCAGPGGKAALLAAIAETRGARLTAGERQPHRAGLVAKAVGNTADVVVADGTRPPWAAGTFDRVLVDVPCSGLGALRRRPESRWRRRPSDLDALRPLQIALLRSALDAARPGGVVGYATCSPHRAETRTIVDAAMAHAPTATLIDARPLMPGVDELGDGPDVQLWPHRHGTDAMYLALIRCD
jgi:16S rRNA (cytosine967-C5)-methyltransferase